MFPLDWVKLWAVKSKDYEVKIQVCNVYFLPCIPKIWLLVFTASLNSVFVIWLNILTMISLNSPSIVELMYYSHLCFKFFIHPFRHFFPCGKQLNRIHGYVHEVVWCGMHCANSCSQHTTYKMNNSLSMLKCYHVCNSLWTHDMFLNPCSFEDHRSGPFSCHPCPLAMDRSSRPWFTSLNLVILWKIRPFDIRPLLRSKLVLATNTRSNGEKCPLDAETLWCMHQLMNLQFVPHQTYHGVRSQYGKHKPMNKYLIF